MAVNHGDEYGSTTNNSVIVVVDPYSSGRELVRELCAGGATLVAVRSSLQLADFWLSQLDAENRKLRGANYSAPGTAGREGEHFVEVIDVGEDVELTSCVGDASSPDAVDAVSGGSGLRAVERVAKELRRKYDVQAVVAGSEPGVECAEHLQSLLRLEGCNDFATSRYRRHKFDMQERLRECGIRCINQIYSDDVEEVLNWQKLSTQQNNGNGAKWPIIVKPAASGGTDGVYWCHCAGDVRDAFQTELHAVNCNGNTNEKLLAQEFLTGTEYVVDSVSFAGKHVLTGIFKYKKHFDEQTKSITYESCEILDSCGAVQEKLVAYMWGCLDALGVQYGPSHGEVMMSDEEKPCLIEVGARLHGGWGCKTIKHATGLACYEVLADLLLNGGKLFHQMAARDFRYVIKKRCLEFMLRKRCLGGDKVEHVLTKELDDGGRITSLPGVLEFKALYHVGDELPITRDLATSPGYVLISHRNPKVVDATIARLKEMERSGELWDSCTSEDGERGEAEEEVAKPALGDSMRMRAIESTTTVASFDGNRVSAASSRHSSLGEIFA